MGLDSLYPATHLTYPGTSRAALVAACLALGVALAAPSLAAPVSKPPASDPGTPAVTNEARRAAQRSFAEGQRAFKTRDFRHAAESFEAAYRYAPHPDALWNAARSWFRAGEKTRAANLYAQYLEEAPPNARDRNSATDALRELSTQLARLEIHATDVDDVEVDNEPLKRTSLYVTPGTHLIQGRHGDEVVKKSQEAAAGAIVSVALVPPHRSEPTKPPPPAPLAPSPALPLPSSPPLPPPRSHGLSPVALVFGAGLTAGAGAVLIWSGLDTLQQKKVFDAHKTQANLDAGRTKQLRTNVMIGVTAGLAALTTITGLFLVDWSRQESEKGPKIEVLLGPGSIHLHGTF